MPVRTFPKRIEQINILFFLKQLKCTCDIFRLEAMSHAAETLKSLSHKHSCSSSQVSIEVTFTRT